MTTIHLDVDGVLLDYARAFLRFSGAESRGVQYENLMSYDFSLLFQGGPEEMLDIMARFHTSEEFSKLAPICGLSELFVLKNLGYKLHIITQVDDIPQARASRIVNLTKLFGPMFDGMTFTVRGQCKLQHILGKNPNEPTIVVEDNPAFLEKADRIIQNDLYYKGTSKHRVFAVLHPYNEGIVRNLEHVVPVKSLHAVTEILMMEHGQ